MVDAVGLPFELGEIDGALLVGARRVDERRDDWYRGRLDARFILGEALAHLLRVYRLSGVPHPAQKRRPIYEKLLEGLSPRRHRDPIGFGVRKKGCVSGQRDSRKRPANGIADGAPVRRARGLCDLGAKFTDLNQ